MSLLLDIASRADVPLEAVVRVLTREPVSEDAKVRVLAVLDDLDAEQTRVLQRFALATVHDILPRPGGHDPPENGESPRELLEATTPETTPATSVAADVAPAVHVTSAIDAAPLVELGVVLTDLTDAVRELRRETDAERRERVDDLAVLIDLITRGWEGVDRRLGRVERQLGRLDAPTSRPRSAATAIGSPPSARPPLVDHPAAGGTTAGADQETLPGAVSRSSRMRDKRPLVATLAVGIGIGAVAALDLPRRADVSNVAATGEDASPRGRVGAPAPSASSTSSVSGDATESPPATTTPQATLPRESGFRPGRSWAWPPTRADYYLVEFFRGGTLLYRARPRDARVTLPDTVVFSPGVYRWRVRPGTGAPAANDLGPPIVDSAFTVR